MSDPLISRSLKMWKSDRSKTRHDTCFTARIMAKVTCDLKCKFRIVVYNMSDHGFSQSQDCLGLYGQVNKRIRWMPWQSEAMKDVVACEKLRGGGKRPLIRRSLNGETHST